MRSVLAIAMLLALGACNPSGEKSPGAAASSPVAGSSADSGRGAEVKATPTPTPTLAAALPQGFPDADPIANAADCIVYIGLSQKAGVNPGGHDGASVDLVVRQWRGILTGQGKMSDTEAQQLIGSSVNPLMATPPALRDAASAWCYVNAPAAK